MVGDEVGVGGGGGSGGGGGGNGIGNGEGGDDGGFDLVLESWSMMYVTTLSFHVKTVLPRLYGALRLGGRYMREGPAGCTVSPTVTLNSLLVSPVTEAAAAARPEGKGVEQDGVEEQEQEQEQEEEEEEVPPLLHTGLCGVAGVDPEAEAQHRNPSVYGDKWFAMDHCHLLVTTGHFRLVEATYYMSGAGMLSSLDNVRHATFVGSYPPPPPSSSSSYPPSSSSSSLSMHTTTTATTTRSRDEVKGEAPEPERPTWRQKERGPLEWDWTRLVSNDCMVEKITDVSVEEFYRDLLKAVNGASVPVGGGVNTQSTCSYVYIRIYACIPRIRARTIGKLIPFLWACGYIHITYTISNYTYEYE